ncbi:MAG: FAD-dependent oxidoreductase [Ilumatobacteraceae bacterium]
MMADDIMDVVIIGGGLAGAKAAETLRIAGFEGVIRLLGDEPERPYERPPLSKGVLIGDVPAEDAFVHAADFYAEHDIDLVTDDGATRLDRDAGEVVTRSGRRMRFDRLLLANGARPRDLPLEVPGALTLRTLDDSHRLGQRLRDVRHVTIVGAGWIGCEVAAAARQLGTDVTMVDPLDVPLQRVLGAELGTVFARLHRDHGVDLRLGVGVDGAAGDGDQVESVRLTDGTTIATELVIVGIGVVPNTELATGAGLEVDDGIVVDATLRTTDHRIFAAGDVANAFHPHYGRHLRVEHWANALHQGPAAARNMLGGSEPFDRLPYFYSDQYDLGLEYVGHPADGSELVVRGDLDAREFIAFWVADGRVTAAMNVNVWDVVEDLKTLILDRTPIAESRLRDPSVPLAELAP